jgi:NitT/TauT family transport system permease protein
MTSVPLGQSTGAVPAPGESAATSGPAAGAAPAGLGLRRRGATLAGTVVPPLVVFVVFLGIWILVSQVILDPDRRFLLPAPWSVVDVGFLDGANRAELLAGLWLTAKAALIGFGLSVAIGMALAIAMSQAKWVERSLFPYAVVLQTVPILALVPLIGFVIGFNFPSRVLVCILIALFPVVTNTLFGLLSAEQGQHDLFTLHRAGRVTRLLKLQLPAAMPAIFAGFRIAAGASVIGAVVGDFFFKQGDPGIGVLIDLYSSELESERLYAAVILSSLLGIAVFVFVGVVERRVVGRWHTSTRHGG